MRGELLDELEIRINRISPRGRMNANPIGEFKVTATDATKALTVSGTVHHVRGISTIRLLRNTSRDPGSAKVLQTWGMNGATDGFALSFDDADQSILTAANVYYWFQAVPYEDTEETLTIGPQQYVNNLDQNPPDAIADFDVSHAAASGGAVVVSVSFKAPVSPQFGSCQIQISGYNGITDYQAIAQGATSPFNFPLSQTGESVTLNAVAVSKNGIQTTGVSPTKALTLGVAATAPAKVMGVTAIELSAGVQLSFPASAEANLTRYDIYRNTRGAGSGSASSLGTVAITGASAYTYLDATGLAGRFGYFVRAVNPAGNGAFSDEANTVQFNTSADVTPVNATGAPTSATTLSNDGATTTITIGAFTQKFAFGNVSYNSGTVDPGGYGTWYVYCDDSNYQGGAVTYHFTSDYATASSGAEGRIYCGGIKTVGGTPGTGGGAGGGSAGTGGGSGGGHGALP